MSDAQRQYEADVARRPTYHDGTPRKTWDRLGPLERSTWARKGPSPAYRIDLTPEGEQTVIPGCERDAAPSVKQLDLF